jgi:hypothetical protein
MGSLKEFLRRVPWGQQMGKPEFRRSAPINLCGAECADRVPER